MSINGIGRPRNWDTHAPTMDRAKNWRVAAEIACQTHRKAMRKEFGKLALKHGISLHDAKLMLMNAVMP